MGVRSDVPEDPDAGRLALVMQVTFFALLGAALVRYLLRHSGEPRVGWVIALAAVVSVLYVLGPQRDLLRRGHSAGAAGAAGISRSLWLGAVIIPWGVLVVLAPSFGWVAVPLFFATLRTLPPRGAYVLIAILTAFMIFAQLRLAPRFDLDLVVGPAAVAMCASAVFGYMQRQGVRQRALIDDLVRTRRELAATERREGTLAERQRLSMEIHDALAQGLSSQKMLLQAAELVWDSDPGAARGHVRTAASIAEHNLREARRFVHDLAPADLADGGGLEQALRALAERESGGELTVRVHVDGAAEDVLALPERVQSALLRIAQGALANVREHSGAAAAAVTLTHLHDKVVLDVADDGRGFDPAALAETSPGVRPGVRGHGVPAMHARVEQLGGALSVESGAGGGTVLTAMVPLAPKPPRAG